MKFLLPSSRQSREIAACACCSHLTYDTTQSGRSVQKVSEQHSAFHLQGYPKVGGTQNIHNVSTLLLKYMASRSGTHLYTRCRKNISSRIVSSISFPYRKADHCKNHVLCVSVCMFGVLFRPDDLF